jgi:hypothetical protein
VSVAWTKSSMCGRIYFTHPRSGVEVSRPHRAMLGPWAWGWPRAGVAMRQLRDGRTMPLEDAHAWAQIEASAWVRDLEDLL